VNELFKLKSFKSSELVSPRIFLRNYLEGDLLVLHKRLTDLGMEYRDGEVYLADLDGS
jgi:hypothetical protein